jgi:hypothetical protein
VWRGLETSSHLLDVDCHAGAAKPASFPIEVTAWTLQRINDLRHNGFLNADFSNDRQTDE